MRSIKRTEYIYHIKSLLLLGLPIIIGQLGNIITGLADTVMVGQHSTEELAAASFVNNVINAFIILGTGFSFNYTPIIGENIAVNKRNCNRRMVEKQPHGKLYNNNKHTHRPAPHIY